jgi:site-specific DNA-cytosine methylase
MVRSVPPGGNWKNIPISIPSKRLAQIRESGGRTTLYGRLKWDKPSYTITTYFNRPGNGTYIHPDHDRLITAREAARLQSFPDNYIFQGSKASMCKQIGNAVPPLLAFSIGKKIKKETGAKNVLDLFSGAGGLSKGFGWAGLNVVAANDNFKEASATYRFNHPNTKFVHGDITSAETKKSLYDAIGKSKIDIVAGGPPCQGFSYAGKRFIDDPRNFLFKEFVAIAKHLNPPIVLMENVEGILTSNEGKTFEGIKESFSGLGYKLAGRKVYAAQYGVPQKRKRIILIGVKKGNPEDLFPEPLISEENNYLSVKDAVSDLTNLEVGENSIIMSLKPESPYQMLMAGLLSPDEFLKKHLNRA